MQELKTGQLWINAKGHLFLYGFTDTTRKPVLIRLTCHGRSDSEAMFSFGSDHEDDVINWLRKYDYRCIGNISTFSEALARSIQHSELPKI